MINLVLVYDTQSKSALYTGKMKFKSLELGFVHADLDMPLKMGFEAKFELDTGM